MTRLSRLKALSLDWELIVVALAVVPALSPLAQPRLFAAHDILHHLYRLFDLDWAVRGGALYPRWLPNLGFGYGYPVLNFYGPLVYYAALVPKLLGLGYLDALKFVLAASTLGAALVFYAWAREHVGGVGAMAAAIAYTYFPYHLADGYVRGALAEHAAFFWFPLILWGERRLIRNGPLPHPPPLAGEGEGGGIALVVTATAWAGLIVTHNLSAYLFIPVALLYAAFELIGSPHPRRDTAWLIGALLLGIAASAFYWLPALSEVGLIRAGAAAATATVDTTRELAPIDQIVSPFWLHRYFPNQGTLTENPLGLVQALAAVLALFVAAVRWPSLDSAARRVLVWAAVVAALCIALMLDWTRPFWQAVPGLTYLQYPWRLQAPIGLTTSMLVGSALAIPTEPSPVDGGGLGWGLLAIAAIVGVAMMWSGMASLPIEPLRLPGHAEPLAEADVSLATMAEYDYQTALWARLYGGPWLLEYLPTTVHVPREEFFLPDPAPRSTPARLDPARLPHIVLGRQGALRRELTVDSPEGMTLRFHTFDFPGWQVRVDGVAVPTVASDRLGLVSADIPVGRHAITLNFEDTPSRQIGLVVSMTAGLAVLAFLAVARQWRLLIAGTIVAAMFVALLIIAGWLAPTAQAPTAKFVNLGDRAALVGYAVDKPKPQPGDAVEVTLYWLALQDIERDYKVFVHLVGDGDRLLAQHDSQPVFNFAPTTRWERGEIVVDRHTLVVPREAVVGNYHLFVGMYRDDTGERLPVLDARGAAVDTRIDLGEVIVAIRLCDGGLPQRAQRGK